MNRNTNTILTTDIIEMVKIVSQLVREGVVFEVYKNTDEWKIVLTGGY